MAVFNYAWTDPGAPQLYCSTAGCYTNILDACLVGTSGTAYGSKASMGWTIEYTGTNHRAYRQPTGTSQFYLSVNDNTATYLYLRGYEAMSDLTTGTGPFPHTTAVASYTQDKCSGVVAGIPIPWRIWSNGKIFYFVHDGSSNFRRDTATGAGSTWVNQPRNRQIIFGDFVSYVTADPYGCLIYSSAPAGTTEPFNSGSNSTTAMLYAARDYTAGASTGKAMYRDAQGHLHSWVDSPSPLFGGSLQFARIMVGESTLGIRGHMPGCWYMLSEYGGYLPSCFNLPDYYVETSDGRQLDLMQLYVSQNVAYERSDTWDDTWPI